MEGNWEGRNMVERTMGREGQLEKELGGEGKYGRRRRRRFRIDTEVRCVGAHSPPPYGRVKGKRMKGCRKGG